LGDRRLLNTPGILTYAITIGVISVEDADRAKKLLEQRKFIMNFSSFRDAIPK
jgi:hypothetical protein